MEPCTSCGKSRDDSSFVKGRSRCRSCVNENTRARYRASRDERLLYKKQYNNDNAVQRREYQAEYRKSNPGIIWAQALKRYGITPEQYAEMEDSQDGRCAACGGEQDNKRARVLCVDHCHNSGRVRGLLCTTCNVALGMLKEQPDRILRLARYAEERCV